MTGGAVYLLDCDPAKLNTDYVKAEPLQFDDMIKVKSLLEEHLRETNSPLAACLLREFEPERFSKVTTRVVPEKWDA
jgi:glutamate synthase (NADPH/NADH) large chain